MPAPATSTVQRLLSPGVLTVLAVLSGWAGIYLIWHQSLVGLFLAVLTTALAWAGLPPRPAAGPPPGAVAPPRPGRLVGA